MTSTVFVDKQTVIEAPWLNDVNTVVYSPTSASSQTATQGQTAVTVPTYQTGALMVGYVDNLAAGAVTQIIASGASASTNMSLYRYEAGAATALGGADIANDFDIVISGSYVF